ncbi:MAG: hypothetical protein AAGH79_11835 [Bacteroidota bacterium]
MQNYINREDLTEETYREILDKETHHDHKIIQDDHGVYRWEEIPMINDILKGMDLNDLFLLLISLGHGKNSEVYRKLYRNMGYSLFGYWEVFYWEVNNEEADRYEPNKIA